MKLIIIDVYDLNIPTRMLNHDVCKNIFDILPMSGKRLFIRTCKFINSLSVYMSSAEAAFQNMINDTAFVSKRYFSGFVFPLYKFTVELLYDDYEIPDLYMSEDNIILYSYNQIYQSLGKKGNLKLIKRLADYNELSEKM